MFWIVNFHSHSGLKPHYLEDFSSTQLKLAAIELFLEQGLSFSIQIYYLCKITSIIKWELIYHLFYQNTLPDSLKASGSDLVKIES